MSIFVFLGPTVPRGEAEAILKAHYLPPAAQGDVLRLMNRRPRAIALIDGYFERRAAVWHKEILWALSRGVPVLGAASMGALRAAELAPFGMLGVGQIFQHYATGALEADDEVAVVHADAEQGYRPLSQALVNIRQTLRAATAAGIIEEALERSLVDLARNTFYPDRNYEGLFEEGRKAGLPEGQLGRLQDWLPSHRIDQKRLDAIALLKMLAASRKLPRPSTSFRFEHTDAWDAALTTAGGRSSLRKR